MMKKQKTSENSEKKKSKEEYSLLKSQNSLWTMGHLNSSCFIPATVHIYEEEAPYELICFNSMSQIRVQNQKIYPIDNY